MSYVIPVVQTVNDGTATRVGHAVRLEDGGVFVLDIDRNITNGFLTYWFDHVATFNPSD